jgi:hypothetical protein
MAFKPPLPPAVVDPLQKAIQTITGSPTVGAVGQTITGAAGAATSAVSGLVPGADAAGSLIDGMVAVRRWIGVRHNWVRVGWFVSGMILMYAGAFMIIKPEVQSGVQAVTDVVPVGKITKAVA